MCESTCGVCVCVCVCVRACVCVCVPVVPLLCMFFLLCDVCRQQTSMVLLI